MKQAPTLFLCIFLLSAYAQTDSTAIKLDQYKKWHEQGMISDADYDGLKQKLLGLQPSTVVKTSSPFSDSAYRTQYHKRYNAEIISGSVCLPLGVGATVTGVIIFLQPPSENMYPGSYEYLHFIKNRNTSAIILFSAGSALTISGAVLLGLGLHQKEIYRNETVALRAFVGGDRVGLALGFWKGSAVPFARALLQNYGQP